MNVLALNGLLMIVAVGLFTRGFLLMRLETGAKSPACISDSATNVQECWRLSKPRFHFEKLVVIIIDALRYDFAKHQERPEDSLAIFHNKMPVFRSLMQEGGCKTARLWRFWADAPTTTMQRIKGLTTGSLPTFIDLSRNFASTEITEDNILDQFIASGRNITFMGDDTWMGLFPNRFNKAYPYPSFDVKDLHLVDDGIMNHLMPEIQEDDWQLLIAHFLGVDHCGHRYGPYHPAMPKKLSQMNKVIEDVVSTIDNKTLLLVMGDHGMTHTGDHGGETFNEVNAALFAYNSAGVFKDCDENSPQDPVVNQVDIVPTISFLVGTSLPFPNLGMVIGAMIPYDSTYHGGNSEAHAGLQKTTESLFLNAKQVHLYIKEYQAASKSFPFSTYTNLTGDFARIRSSLGKRHSAEDTSIAARLATFLKAAREMCREVWARFDVLSMLAGLSMTVLVLVLNMHWRNPCFKTVTDILLKLLLFLTSASVIISYFVSSLGNTIFCLLMALASFVVAALLGCHTMWTSYGKMSVLELVFPSFLLAAYVISFTTNSFILNEDITTMFLSLSAITCLTLTVFLGDAFHTRIEGVTNQAKKGKEDGPAEHHTDASKLHPKLPNARKRRFPKTQSAKANGGGGSEKPPFLSWKHFSMAMLGLGALLSTRLAIYFRFCRAEQFWCFTENSDTSGSQDEDFSASGYSTSSFLLSCFNLVVSVSLLLWTMKTEGNLKNSLSLNVFLCRKLFPICTVWIMIGWLLITMPPKLLTTLPPWCITACPRLVYGGLVFYMICHWINPVFTHILYPDGRGTYTESPSINRITGNGNAIPQAYNLLKEKIDKDLKEANQESDDSYGTPIAFGLYTVFTASTISVVLCAVLLFSMLLGPEKSASLLLGILSAYAVLELNAVLMHQKRTSFVPWSSVVTWGLLSSYWWFATGHQASISSIQWDAAFVGFQGSHSSNAVPALLVLLNTFSMQILSTVALPLLMFWPLTKGKWSLEDTSHETVNNVSELLFYKDAERFFAVLDDLFVKYFSFHTAKMVGCMVCACLHRRHLMVWQIFAPRYMFEGVSLLIVLISSIVTIAQVCNTGSKLGKWLLSVESLLR